jgi:hypothetical protein
MDAPFPELQRLGTAQTKEQLTSAVWDLRDSAYDEPQLWTALTAEGLFQCLAQELENEPGDEGALTPSRVLARAFEKALTPG